MPMTPDRDRRSSGGGRGQPRNGGYKVLCVSSLHPKASDDVIRDTLYREYKKFGDISVRVVQDPDERVAYVYFRNFEDARDAKHNKSRIILFDKAAIVEPVYESRSAASESRDGYEQPRGGGSGSRRRSLTPPPPQSYGGSYGGGGDRGGGGSSYPRESAYPPSRYRSRSPVERRGYDDHHRGGYDDHRSEPRDYAHQRERDFGHRDHHYRDDRGPPPRGGGGYGGGYRDRDHGGHDDFRRGDRGPPRGRGRGRGGYHDDGGRGRGGYRGGGEDRGGMDRGDQNKFNKDKFPNYLNHISPEDDPLATRTLFIGNLELNITDDEMRRIFGRYGKLVDIDIKRPPPGTGNAYAFIRYENLDMSSRAKVELSGQYIGKFQCKIGYGKVNATPKVWIGGLGAWASISLLEREFDRFGAIQKIEYHKGDPQAHIFYETLEAAQAAVGEMRGFTLGGAPDKRIRIDYADLDDGSGGYGGGGRDTGYGGRGGGRGGRGGDRYSHGGGGRGGRGGYGDDRGPPQRYHHGGGGPPHRGEAWRDDDGGPPPAPPGEMDDFSSAKSIADLTRTAFQTWEGGLILKNSLFPTKLLMIEGASRIADSLKDNEQTSLKITQRLRLDPSKLDDVTRRMTTASSHAVFLSVPTTANIPNESSDVQSRPLRNLISYLKQKEAAGVISMSHKDLSGVLYCFPPCAFSFDLLKREAPYLNTEESKDDHLVVLVVCGGSGGAATPAGGAAAGGDASEGGDQSNAGDSDSKPPQQPEAHSPPPPAEAAPSSDGGGGGPGSDGAGEAMDDAGGGGGGGGDDN